MIQTEPQVLQRIEKMLLIRRFEERLIELHTAGEFPGHYHVYIGQEATAVAACEFLTDSDYLYTTHRNHGHLLARGASPDRMLAEIMGKVDGYNRGRGGTLHLAAADLNVPVTSALVGGSLPIATGTALSLKKRGIPGMVIAFFGDGVLEEGAFYEAMNLAGVWEVPILYVCENNSIPPNLRKAGQYPSSTLTALQLTDVPAAFNIPSEIADGADMVALLEIFSRSIKAVREEKKPRFIEVRCSRWPGSFELWPSLVDGVTDISWAWGGNSPSEDLNAWNQSSDPLLLYIRRTLTNGSITRDQLAKLDEEVRERINKATEFARQSPFPDALEAYELVFAREENAR